MAQWEQKQDNIIIAVWSPVSAGATTITASLFAYLNKYTDLNVTAIDADISNPCPHLHQYLGIGLLPEDIERKGEGLLNIIAGAISKGQFTNEVYNEILVRYGKRGSIITGNTSLADMESIWNGDENSSYFNDTGKCSFDFYDEILKKAKQTSNIVIADCSRDIFMDSTKFFLHASDFVILVTRSDLPQLNTTGALLWHSIENFGVVSEKVLLLINQYNSSSLNMNEAKQMLNGYRLLSTSIRSKPDAYSSAVNSGNILSCVEKDKTVYDEIVATLGIVKKKGLVETLKHRIAGGL